MKKLVLPDLTLDLSVFENVRKEKMERIKAEIFSHTFDDRCKIINSLIEVSPLVINPNTTTLQKNVKKFIKHIISEPEFKKACKYIYDNIQQFQPRSVTIKASLE